MQAQELNFSLDESQWRQDWASLLNLASEPGKAARWQFIHKLFNSNNNNNNNNKIMSLLYST